MATDKNNDSMAFDNGLTLQGRTFAERLKQARERKGMTMQEVANKLGVTQQGYAYYEKGTSTPSIKNAKRLADALGIDMGALLNEPPLFEDPSFNKLNLTEDQKRELNDLILTDSGKALNRLEEIMNSQGADIDKIKKMALYAYAHNTAVDIESSSQDKVLNVMYQKLSDLGYLVEAMDKGFRITNRTTGNIYSLSTQEVKDLYEDAENYLKARLEALEQKLKGIAPGAPAE